MIEEKDRIALIDLDGTVADYDRAMTEMQRSLAAPGEEITFERDQEPTWLETRRRLIQNQPGFWRNLQRIELGFQILDELRLYKYKLQVLTKGPSKSVPAWSEKVLWAQEQIPDAGINIVSETKTLTYGSALVDDWPNYFLPWLEVRPRALVISVAQPWNLDIKHPNVFRYDGSNHAELVERIQENYNRK